MADSARPTHGLLGAAGHASDLLGILEASAAADGERLDVVVFADGDVDESRFIDRPARYVGAIIDVAAHRADRWFLAVGYPGGRRALAAQIAHLDLPWATGVHPDATIGTGSIIGPGSVVLAGGALSPRVVLGAHVVISQTTSVGHDTQIGDFSAVMPLACVSGDCTIGEGVLIGSGATVLEKVTIGDGATVGAGALVLADVEPGATVVGAPAKAITTR